MIAGCRPLEPESLGDPYVSLKLKELMQATENGVCSGFSQGHVAATLQDCGMQDQRVHGSPAAAWLSSPSINIQACMFWQSCTVTFSAMLMHLGLCRPKAAAAHGLASGEGNRAWAG